MLCSPSHASQFRAMSTQVGEACSHNLQKGAIHLARLKIARPLNSARQASRQAWMGCYPLVGWLDMVKPGAEYLDGGGRG